MAAFIARVVLAYIERHPELIKKVAEWVVPHVEAAIVARLKATGRIAAGAV